MTEAEVRNRILIFADGETDPVLTSADLDILVADSKTVDKYGVRPIDDGWLVTYDLYWAIAQAWLLKASRVSPRYLFMSGGKMFSRQQYYDHCMKQHKLYAGKSRLRAIRLGHTPLGLGNVPTNV